MGKHEYVIVYAKFIDDKKLGIILVGIFFGGVAATQEQADEIATRCVSETQGGMVIPKVVRMRHDQDLRQVISELEQQFEKLADAMYENEKLL